MHMSHKKDNDQMRSERQLDHLKWETAKEGGWGSHGDSRERHPDFVWYPATAKGNPILDRMQYLDIVGQGENR